MIVKKLNQVNIDKMTVSEIISHEMPKMTDKMTPFEIFINEITKDDSLKMKRL